MQKRQPDLVLKILQECAAVRADHRVHFRKAIQARVPHVHGENMKKLFLIAAAGILIAITSSTFAAPNCAIFEKAIDATLREIATKTVEGLGDDSAPRATLRVAQINNDLVKIQINLMIMQANGCTMPKEPIRGTEYVGFAVACSAAESKALLERLKDQYAEMRSLPECDTAKWARNFVPEAKP
jgi:hypothetical protein